jgi:hypothetical protein
MHAYAWFSPTRYGQLVNMICTHSPYMEGRVHQSDRPTGNAIGINCQTGKRRHEPKPEGMVDEAIFFNASPLPARVVLSELTY